MFVPNWDVMTHTSSCIQFYVSKVLIGITVFSANSMSCDTVTVNYAIHQNSSISLFYRLQPIHATTKEVWNNLWGTFLTLVRRAFVSKLLDNSSTHCSCLVCSRLSTQVPTMDGITWFRELCLLLVHFLRQQSRLSINELYLQKWSMFYGKMTPQW